MSLSAPNYDTTAVPRVLKLDGNANVLWDRTYGQASGLDSQEPRAVAATVDGGCVVACQRSLVIIGAKGSKTNTYISQVVLRKLDSVGDVVWERNLESPTGYMGVARMIPVNGDGFVLVGADSQILRVDAAGNALWWNLYGGGWTTGVGVASDGGFVLVGTSQESFPTPEVFRTDASGNLLWSAVNIIPNQGNAQYTVRDAILDTEGRMVLVGQLEHVAYVGNFFPIITYDSFIMQLDSSAHLNWSKTLPVYELNGIALTNTGDYVTTGADGNDLKVIRVTTAGNVM
ncbi:MAG: hypothetical protein HZB26_14235 [Candidatus Hydrogenedentes bacterium]|nr:hypothetical protein [Candidatus Hydrogenedentota bacterium]